MHDLTPDELNAVSGGTACWTPPGPTGPSGEPTSDLL